MQNCGNQWGETEERKIAKRSQPSYCECTQMIHKIQMFREVLRERERERERERQRDRDRDRDRERELFRLYSIHQT